MKQTILSLLLLFTAASYADAIPSDGGKEGMKDTANIIGEPAENPGIKSNKQSSDYQKLYQQQQKKIEVEDGQSPGGSPKPKY